MASLYIHVPFCSQRCVYCDFYFVTTEPNHRPYVRALQREIEHYGNSYGEAEPVDTIYFGGGTPSLLSVGHLATILQTIYDHFDCSTVEETTIEINPEDLSLDDLEALRGIGFDRLSIGIQSFFQEDLEFMNRAHSAEEAEQVLADARQAGFDNFTIDLIFGLPDQPYEYWMANLQKAIRYEVPHLSTYGLTVEPRTVLAKQIERGVTDQLDEDAMAERYLTTIGYLREHGYEHYEISSFARPGYRAVHNANYWNHTNYLGFGPSAHSFWKGGLGRGTLRWANVRNLRLYTALLEERELPVDERERLDRYQLGEEYAMLQLRTADGIDLGHLRDEYGIDLELENPETMDRLAEGGLIDWSDDRLRLTDEGKLLCDTITTQLLSID